MNFINPFHELFETKKYPLARTLRTTFWGKVWDTFKVFSGNLIPQHIKNNKKNPNPYKQVHSGVFDYLTLGLHFLLSELLLRALKKIRLPAVIKIMGLATLLLINIPRLIFAALLTLICLPFVGIAEVLSKIKGDNLKNEIRSYTVKTEEFKVYFTHSELPYTLENCKNSFFFIENTNSLFYVDFAGDAQKIELPNPDALRELVGNKTQFKDKINYYYFIKRDILSQFFPELNSPGTYHSLGELLKIKDIDLETVEKISIEADADERMKLSFQRDQSTVTRFSISAQKRKDFIFFNNLSKLNIGGIQEHNEEMSAKIS
ncbi:MAG: hypothetical protein Q8M03_02925 [Legionella sp.]|nr:hypothetical protein [Legionella sp.]